MVKVKMLMAALGCLMTSAALAADCQVELNKHLQSDLQLPYKEFDQSPGKGFRPLAGLGCHKEAADLLLVYMQANRDYTPSLTWHVAQQRAMQGENVIAAKYARMSLKDKEDFAVQPLRWNDYVLATIAFLERDVPKLKLHRDKVAEGKAAFWGNGMNLAILDKLVAHPGQSYKQANEQP